MAAGNGKLLFNVCLFAATAGILETLLVLEVIIERRKIIWVSVPMTWIFSATCFSFEQPNQFFDCLPNSQAEKSHQNDDKHLKTCAKPKTLKEHLKPRVLGRTVVSIM